MKRKFLLAGGGLLVAVLIIYAVMFVGRVNLFRELEETAPGECARLAGFIGPEDIVIDYARGLAYVTVSDRRAALFKGGGSPKGAIARLDLDADPVSVTLLTPLPRETFFPHGLDLHIGEDGTRRLFVVDHGADGDTHSIVIFRIEEEGGGLVEEARISDPLITSPNDVAALGPRAFLTTNDQGAKTRFGKTLETYTLYPGGNLIHFDGEKARKVAGGFRYANGVEADEGYVYVAAVLDENVTVFERRADGTLEEIGAVDVDMGVDNVTLDPDGSLWAAGHPKPLEFPPHADDASVPASSEVVHIANPADDRVEVKTVYLDRGAGISAASVAARYEDRLLIGAVFSPHMLVCALES